MTKAKTKKRADPGRVPLSKAKPGMWFSARIEGTPVVGKLSQGAGNNWYLCQDTKDGAEASNRQGYMYSWYVGALAVGGGYDDVTQLKVFKKCPRMPPLTLANVRIASEKIIFCKGYIEVGCNRIQNNVVKLIAKNLKAK